MQGRKGENCAALHTGEFDAQNPARDATSTHTTITMTEIARALFIQYIGARGCTGGAHNPSWCFFLCVK